MILKRNESSAFLFYKLQFIGEETRASGGELFEKSSAKTFPKKDRNCTNIVI